MKTYQKINTMYKRYQHMNKETCPNPKWMVFSNQIILHEFSNEVAEYLFDCEWEGYCKIDGTNSKIAFYPSSGEIKVGGKTDNANSIKGQFEFLEKIGERIKPMLQEMFPKETAKFEQVLGDDKKPIYGDIDENTKSVTLVKSPIYIYGEYYGEGVQKSGGAYGERNFAVFDINQQGWWIPSDMRHDICSKLGLNEVPYFGRMTLREIEERVRKGFPTYVPNANDPSFIEEGVVCRPPIGLKDSRGERVIVKVKHGDYMKYDKARSQFTDEEFNEFNEWYKNYIKTIEK